MFNHRLLLEQTLSNVRRCLPGAFCVILLTHLPFLMLPIAVLSALFEGGRFLIPAVIGGVFFLLLWVFAAMPMTVSLSGYFIALSKERSPRILSIFSVFQDGIQYRHALLTVLHMLFRIALNLLLCLSPLTLLPLVPPYAAPYFIGLCALLTLLVMTNRALSYSFITHFAWEYPYLTAREALRLSKLITQGQLLSLLYLLLPLMVLILIGIMTLGLFFIFALPFYYAAFAACYLELKTCEGVNLPSPKEYVDVSDDATR